MKLASWMLSGIGFARSVANKTASSVGNFLVKSKHLMGAGGDWAKFATKSQSQIQGWISQALTKGSNFVVNSQDSYYVIYTLISFIYDTKGWEIKSPWQLFECAAYFKTEELLESIENLMKSVKEQLERGQSN